MKLNNSICVILCLKWVFMMILFEIKVSIKFKTMWYVLGDIFDGVRIQVLG